MVASYNLKTNQIYLFSIPRDLWLPALKSKANAVYQIGLSEKEGLELSKTVFGNVLGLPIHYAVRVDFRGFVQAIPWAIVFSVAWVFTLNITMSMLRQEVKEAIEYAAKTGVSQSVHAVLTDPEFDKNLWPKIKQNTKEAIEYTVTMASRKQAASSQPQSKK